MIKLEDSNDMRIKILLHLEKEDFALEQIAVNEFLSKLTTINGQHDLGTIRRALQDLVRERYIMETTNEEGIINSCHLATVGDKAKECGLKWSKNRSNSKRFSMKVGEAEKIPDLYLGITLKGKSFLTDRRVAESNHDLIVHSISAFKEGSKWYNHKIIWMLIAFVFTISGGVIQQSLTQTQEYTKVNIEAIDIPERINLNVEGDSLTISQ